MGVYDEKEHRPEPALIDGIEVRFEELKSKNELFTFFDEGSCTHTSLMEFCEDYKKRYGNDLCWPYHLTEDKHLGLFLVLVKEGVLCLPYDGFDGETYEFFDLKDARLLQTKQVMQLAADWQSFSQGLLCSVEAMCENGFELEG